MLFWTVSDDFIKDQGCNKMFLIVISFPCVFYDTVHSCENVNIYLHWKSSSILKYYSWWNLPSNEAIISPESQYSVSWLLITWWCQEPGHQQRWFRLSPHGILPYTTFHPILYFVTWVVNCSLMRFGEILWHFKSMALVQECSNSSALAMELLQSCTEPSKC